MPAELRTPTLIYGSNERTDHAIGSFGPPQRANRAGASVGLDDGRAPGHFSPDQSSEWRVPAAAALFSGSGTGAMTAMGSTL